MSAKKTSSLQQFNLNRLTYLLIPVLAAALSGFFLLGTREAVLLLRFELTLLLFGIATFPLAAYLFPLSRSGGLTLSKSLGLLSTGLGVWVLTYLKIGRLNIFFIIFILIGVAFACWFPRRTREELFDVLGRDNTIQNIAFEETIFVLILTILCFYKGFKPEINGQEKFMDYGFMMSMIRNSKLPANDMWLSGHSINYYYFGQYIYAMITRVSMINTGVSYNISMCCAIALPFSMCYSIGQMLLDGARKNGMTGGFHIPVIGGILTAFAVTIFGNSHSFYYDQDSIGNGLLSFFSKLGANVGTTDGFFYPNSTRYIGHNPDSATLEGIRNGGDYTIEEFPFYSYLVGDLHAHVCSMIVVLLIVALSVSLIYRLTSTAFNAEMKISSAHDIKGAFLHELKLVLCPELIGIAVLLGISQMTNYWDFLIYFIFSSMVLLIVTVTSSDKFSTIAGAFIFAVSVGGILGLYLVFAYHPVIHALLQIILLGSILFATSFVPCALTRTGAGMSFLFAAATLVALPFNANFDMISNKIAPCQNHSPLFQLFILWGTHVIICVTFLIFTIIYRNVAEKKGRGKTHEKTYTNPVAGFFGRRNPMDVLVCGAIIVGILLLIAPEIFYVRDIYTGGYLRSNTMFKFTYAGFIILSICMIYSVLRLMYMTNNKSEFSVPAFVVSLVFFLMLFVPAHYTLVSLKQRSGELKMENYRTLNGVSYLTEYQSPNLPTLYAGNLIDYDSCIKWFNEMVPGDPVIMEAYGNSYTDYNIVSAYTGLPSVCGWQTHEWLWRFHGIVNEETDLLESDPENDVWELYLTPRHYDIDTVYTTSDTDTIRQILDKYEVEYVIIGDLERAKYDGHDNTGNILAAGGEIAYVAGDLVVVKFNR